MLKKVLLFFSKNSVQKYFLIFLGTVLWSLVMVRSGLCWDDSYSGGLGFWGANGHDGIWHVSLIQSLSRGSFQMPIFAGENIQNYHIGFDLLMSWIVRLTGVSVSVLYFQIIPPVLAFLIGLLVYKFVYLWKSRHALAMWSLFFVYFGGSFGWIVSLLRGQGWGGESMFWSQQSISTLINPPFALSLITMLLGMIFLTKYLHKKTWINFLGAFFLFGITIFIKVYAGLLILTALFAVSIWHLIKNKDLSLLGGFVISFTISAVLFILFNKSSANLVSVSPFWFLETMVGLSDRFYWPRLFSAMTTYKMGHMVFKALAAYMFAFVIFMIGNFGTRILMFGVGWKNFKKVIFKDTQALIMIVLISAGVIVPLFFVQKGTPWNTIQFFYYSLIFSGILAGLAISEILANPKFVPIAPVLGIFIILLTIPTTIASLGNYLPPKPQSVLPSDELSALEFLSGQPDGVVLTYPFDSIKAGLAKAPRPLYLYTSTAYVSAFSSHPVFLEDEINLDIMQYSWISRKEGVENFLNNLNEAETYQFLRDNNIMYVYWLKDQHARVGDKQLGMTKIFEKGDVKIFKVN